MTRNVLSVFFTIVVFIVALIVVVVIYPSYFLLPVGFSENKYFTNALSYSHTHTHTHTLSLSLSPRLLILICFMPHPWLPRRKQKKMCKRLAGEEERERDSVGEWCVWVWVSVRERERERERVSEWEREDSH